MTDALQEMHNQYDIFINLFMFIILSIIIIMSIFLSASWGACTQKSILGILGITVIWSDNNYCAIAYTVYC